MGKLLNIVIVLSVTLLFLTPVITSCSDQGCLDNRNSIPLVKLYDFNSPAKTISIDSISVYGLDQIRDSILIDSVNGTSELSLPFRINFDSTVYVIQYNYQWNVNRKMNDTLVFFYDSYIYFASIDCGSMFNFTLDSMRYTKHMLDSVAVTNAEITNKNVENIRLFYPTAEGN